MPEINEKKISFQAVIDALLNDDADFPATYLTAFSDIESQDLVQLLGIWNQITPERKARLFENLEILNDSDTLVDLHQIASVALTDPSAAVRASGIRMLLEYDNEKHIPLLIELLQNDIDLSVRAHAAGALGKFIYLGEIEEIKTEVLENIVTVLLAVIRSSENELVRQKALESLGYSSHKDINSIINNAFQSTDTSWLASALLAMGRSADETWVSQVLSMLAHPDFRIQREAIRAAGELEIKSARNLLLKLVQDSEPDEDVWTESVWALSKIGGGKVHGMLEKLLKNADTEEEEDFLREALDNLFLTEGIAGELEFMGLSEPDQQHLREFSIEDEDIDLDDEGPSWVADLEDALEEDMDEDFYDNDNDGDEDLEYDDEDEDESEDDFESEDEDEH